MDQNPGEMRKFYILYLVGATLAFVVLVSLFGSLFNWDGVCMAPLVVVYGVIAIVLIKFIVSTSKQMKMEKDEELALGAVMNTYDDIKRRVNIPFNAKLIDFLHAGPYSSLNIANSSNGFHVWKSENELKFFPNSPRKSDSIYKTQMVITTLPFDRIDRFEKTGELFRETKISGGGGGGSSLTGAIVGGAIAGDAGAVIGSRKKVNPVTSQLITHDSRETAFFYFSEKNQRHTWFFNLDAYNVFSELIPEKESSVVNAVKTSQIIQNQAFSQKREQMFDHKASVTDQLRELAKLRDEGIISEQEFIEKKKILLDKIK